MHLVLTSTILGIFATGALAQPPDAVRPRVSNGMTTERRVTQSLAATIGEIAAAERDVVWIGWAVAALPGDRDLCCWDNNWTRSGGCRLEPQSTGAVNMTRGSDVAQPLEPDTTLIVLARFERGRLERIRVFSPRCALDAGGRPVAWLTSVTAADSVSFLASTVTSAPTNRIVDGATTAIAMHAGPRALEWLLTTARTGQSTHLRGQALFWLAQRAGDRAVGAITEAIDRDPDTEVKRRAVFALSQLPGNEGVPRLITVARSHSNQVVRKQAFFWLGQSKDPRALEFFREVLAK